MSMMMITIAGFVDSVMTPINSWLERLERVVIHKKTANMTVQEVGSQVECIVCLSEVALGDRYAMLERCGHGFHVECVEAWLKDHPNCPLCRTPMISCAETVYLKIMSLRVLETLATWLTGSFSQGLQSTLSESCTYL